MFVYNTLSGKKEKIMKPAGRPLQLFVCGPTVYDDAHLGHARTYIFFDLFVRYLRSRGWNVFYLQNITDIDDKIIARARKEKKNPLVLARFFEKRYREDMKKLGIASVNRYAPATKFIPEIIRQVQTLIKKGYAYKTSDGYYFNIGKFKDYGKLSRRTALQAEDAVSRIDESVEKIDKGDFALWKFVPGKSARFDKISQNMNLPARMKIINGEPAWVTPLGAGRPGWHIEDTAISEKFFGPQYDLHGGGIDLKFPHHEAEIAQQEAASGKTPFVKIWMHVGFLLVGGEKMAKSLKNFITIRKFLKKNPADVLRFIILAHHYRSPINFTDELVRQARLSLETLRAFSAKMDFIARHRRRGAIGSKIKKTITETEEKFRDFLADDFNTPGALAELFKFISTVEKNAFQLTAAEAAAAKKFILENLALFGLKIKTPPIPPEIKALLRKRELFRRNKQFKSADLLRKKLTRVGYEVEDTPLGPFIRRRL